MKKNADLRLCSDCKHRTVDGVRNILCARPELVGINVVSGQPDRNMLCATLRAPRPEGTDAEAPWCEELGVYWEAKPSVAPWVRAWRGIRDYIQRQDLGDMVMGYIMSILATVLIGTLIVMVVALVMRVFQ